MAGSLKNIIQTRAFISLVTLFIRSYTRTLRYHIKNEAGWRRLIENGEAVFFCGWHQQIFPIIRPFARFSGFRPAVMISQSRDGEFISGVALKVGWEVVRGSSSRGGRTAMSAMIRHINRNGMAAHLLDGPRGPMGKVKAGAVKIAQETGAKVVPFHVDARSAWHARSWDRFMIPRPFSRVTLVFGKPITFERTRNRLDFESQRQYLEHILQPGLVRPKR